LIVLPAIFGRVGRLHQAAGRLLSGVLSSGFMVNVREQVRKDAAMVKVAMNLVVPEPARSVAAQGLAAVWRLLNALRRAAVVSVLPKARELFLVKESPGRKAGSILAASSLRGLA